MKLGANDFPFFYLAYHAGRFQWQRRNRSERDKRRTLVSSMPKEGLLNFFHGKQNLEKCRARKALFAGVSVIGIALFTASERGRLMGTKGLEYGAYDTCVF